jgi:hypothetical protein
MKKLSSERKIAANRENARHSTGPKSARGKSKSRENAVKHGIYSTTKLLIGENKVLYKIMRRELRKKYSPQTHVEQALVACLMAELWNLRRILRAEQLLGADAQQDLNEDLEGFEYLKADEEDNEQGEGDEEDNEQGDSTAADVSPQVDVDAVYEQLFLNSDFDRMQRLTTLKRQTLNTILGLEKELDRRLRVKMRAISKEEE